MIRALFGKQKQKDTRVEERGEAQLSACLASLFQFFTGGDEPQTSQTVMAALARHNQSNQHQQGSSSIKSIRFSSDSAKCGAMGRDLGEVMKKSVSNWQPPPLQARLVPLSLSLINGFH